MSPSASRPSTSGSGRHRARAGRSGGWPRALDVALVTGLVVALGACSTGDGTTLRPPTAPPPTVAPDLDEAAPSEPGEAGEAGEAVSGDSPDEVGLAAFELFTPWPEDGDLDASYTCDGVGVSPPLAWSPAPAGSVELVLAMTQLTDTGDAFDEIGVVHWLVAGISPTLTSTPEGGLPPGAVPLINAYGNVGWTAPCPPEGLRADYRFTVYALAEPLGDVSGLPLDAVVDQVRFTSTATAASEASFTRSG